MLKWLRQFDWDAIFGSALILVLALWFLAANPDYEPNPATYKNPLEYAVGVVRFILGLLPPDGWTALFTFALFISTFALWRVTRQSVEVASRALTDLERPYIFVHGVSFHRSMGTNPHTISYRVSNNGKLAAVVELVGVRCGVKRNDLFPSLAIIADHQLLRTPILIANEPPAIFDFQLKTDLMEMEFDPAERSPIHGLIIQIFIAYRGPFTKGHETAQCWSYHKSINGFLEVSDPGYTYLR